jgi:hypothetical protein
VVPLGPGVGSGFLPYYYGFFMIFKPIIVDFAHFWEILGIFGGQILGGSWGWITNFRSIKTRPV